jgi:hypothetical protein
LNIEKNIGEQVRQFALLQYARMAKENNFGEGAKLQNKMDFARQLLALPAEHAMAVADLDRFHLLINDLTKELATLSLPVLKQKEREFCFEIDGQKFKRHQFEEINQLLAENYSKKRLFVASRKAGFTVMVFGLATQLLGANNKVYVIKEEEIRTPAANLAIAAFTLANNVIVIRRQVLKHSFYIRWVRGQAPKNQQAREFAKQCLAAYQVASRSKLLLAREEFMSEMLESTLIHEISHRAQSSLDADFSAIARIFPALSSTNSLEILNELMVDWNPDKEHQGIFAYLCDLSKQSYPKAKRMFYRYLVDSCFDQGDFSLLTELLYSLAAKYIDAAGEVDFTVMNKDLGLIHEKLVWTYQRSVSAVVEQVKQASFVHNGAKVTFSQLKTAQKIAFKRQAPAADPASAEYKNYFWGNMLTIVKKCSQETFVQIDQEIVKLIGSLRKPNHASNL